MEGPVTQPKLEAVTPIQQPCQIAINTLEEMLELARAGRLVFVAVVGITPERNPLTAWSRTTDALTGVGAISMLLHEYRGAGG